MTGDEDTVADRLAARLEPVGGAAVERAIALIARALGELGSSSSSAVADVRRRLRDGGAAYGPLDARLDPRRWVDEAVEELLDALVYLECEIMRREAREEEEVQR